MDEMRTLKKELILYLMPKHYFLYAVGIIVTVWMAVSGTELDVFLVAALFLNFMLIWSIWNLYSVFRKYKKAEQMDLVLQEFRDGRFLCDDAVCLGTHVVIGRGNCNILSYDEIDTVYQHVTTSCGSILRSALLITTKNFWTSNMMISKKGGMFPEAEVNRFYQLLQQKNPSIKIDREIQYEEEEYEID